MPTLDALATTPLLIRSLSITERLEVYLKAERLKVELFNSLLMDQASVQCEPADTVLTVAEAAALLGTTKDTLYRKWRRLDFAYRDGLDNRVKFSRRGLAHYVEAHLKRPVSRA